MGPTTWSVETDDLLLCAVPSGLATAATDLHEVTGLSGSWRGVDLGALRPVTPEPRFGFGSTPERPSVTSLVTTVLLPGA